MNGSQTKKSIRLQSLSLKIIFNPRLKSPQWTKKVLWLLSKVLIASDEPKFNLFSTREIKKSWGFLVDFCAKVNKNLTKVKILHTRFNFENFSFDSAPQKARRQFSSINRMTEKFVVYENAQWSKSWAEFNRFSYLAARKTAHTKRLSQHIAGANGIETRNRTYTAGDHKVFEVTSSRAKYPLTTDCVGTILMMRNVSYLEKFPKMRI